MTLDRSAAIMDAIFASPDEDQHARLLKIFQDFMSSEAAKHSNTEKGGDRVKYYLLTDSANSLAEAGKSAAKNAGVQMEELVGNTDGFADSG